ncbi:MAG: 16S rRNA (cytosine(1402)-N(4))-methyltransferase RsmH [Bifidobacteriaceae bacterium]|jgi:16S rRNA (cytosine1402-N4)-methyltransferase|nr:16S rRNA (cytosine(1402)-N(4))-methyltransferase RsmH [Bifidobacteriaceae bacterium]
MTTSSSSAADALSSTDLSAIHQPVLLDTCVKLMLPSIDHDGAVAVDGTLGLAGHSQAFLAAAPGVHLIGIDRDEEALGLASTRLERFGDRFTPVHSSFDRFAEVLDHEGIDTVDAAFLDLGLSSLQIDETDRGFSYSTDAPLDMRMDPTQSLTAADIVNTYDLEDLTRIFKEYGEEKYSYKIAQRIVDLRDDTVFTHSSQIVELVDATVPRYKRPAGNPAKRVFQALRIEVNGELDKLRSVLPQIAERLTVGGRIVVESYHSLEDRTVKGFFTLGTRSHVPQGLPVIPDELKPYFRDVSHGAIKADEDEIARNPRSASVRLRAVELMAPLPDHAHSDFSAWVDGHLAGGGGGHHASRRETSRRDQTGTKKNQKTYKRRAR